MGRLTCLRPRVEAAPLRREMQAVGHERQATGRPWRRIRHGILTRDCGMCQPCLRDGHFSLAVDVDHITPVWEGGTDADRNLQAICSPCHKAKSWREAARRAAGGGPA